MVWSWCSPTDRVMGQAFPESYEPPTPAQDGGCLAISWFWFYSCFYLFSDIIIEWFLSRSIIVKEWSYLMLMFYEIVYVQEEKSKTLLWKPGQQVATPRPEWLYQASSLISVVAFPFCSRHIEIRVRKSTKKNSKYLLDTYYMPALY